jgi:hypothetical protein
VTILALLASIVALNIAGIAWLANPGSDAHLVEKVESVAPPQLDLPNPAVPGRYQVQTWFYGSGTDKRRPEYGKIVKLKTTTVDASPFLPRFTGVQAKLHQWFWGFNTQHFPFNGQVWFPVGDGAFPLVLIVHGRHSADEFSDLGYAYLGKLLASRGSIAVSVDENFLNGPWLSDRTEEMPIRAWILLQHLKVWRTWNATAINPFYNKVDLTQIAPIGHSRGGEAIAVAEDIHPITTTVPDGVEQADNLEVWREQELLLRSKSHLSQENGAVYLEWDKADAKADPSAKIASYTINLPNVTRQNWQIDRDKYLAFDLANATTEESRPLDFIVELIDIKGTMAALPLSQFAPIQYPLQIQISKLNWLEGLLWKPSELVLQTYQLPLADFMKISLQFNPSQIETIRFQFDRTKAGAIVLDEFVFRRNKYD